MTLEYFLNAINYSMYNMGMKYSHTQAIETGKGMKRMTKVNDRVDAGESTFFLKVLLGYSAVPLAPVLALLFPYIEKNNQIHCLLTFAIFISGTLIVNRFLRKKVTKDDNYLKYHYIFIQKSEGWHDRWFLMAILFTILPLPLTMLSIFSAISILDLLKV